MTGRSNPVPKFLIVTVALGTTAPLVSMIVPRTVAKFSCALRVAPKTNNCATKTVAFANRDIISPPWPVGLIR